MNEQDWLGLSQRDDGSTFAHLEEAQARHDGALYGGTGVALLTAAMARRTGRHPLWVTTQFVASARMGDTLEIEVEVLAEGRFTSQVRMTARSGDQIVLAGLGAAGVPQPDALHADFATMPEVTPYEGTTAWGSPPGEGEDPHERFGPRLVGEFRRARGADGTFRLWYRLTDQRHTPESIAYVADVVPGFVIRQAGRAGWGSSLDNTIRFGPPPDCEWVLLDVVPFFIDSGFVHGAARVWSPEGVLLAVADQTARAKLFD